jgi:hypothetical protein
MSRARNIHLVLLVLAALAPAGAQAGERPESDRTTFLLSRSAAGGFPNGPSRSAAVSHDQRIARLMAYESDATDIVAGDSNGWTDVFLVRRDAPFGSHGTPWRIGRTELASTGLGGQPANGRSYRPALDGDAHHRPHCLAFVSDASNLVPGDTNGKADAFVRDLDSGRVQRVSVDSAGRQSNGTTTEVVIDGACERVAFVSDATNLALRRTRNAAWTTARTSSGAPGTRQAYVRVLDGERHDRGFRGLTFLASASRSGRAGNGDSFDVVMARNGKAVAFASNATNLSPGDGDPRADVYERSFERRFEHVGHGRGVQKLVFATALVSATPGGRAGNGASTHPAIDDVGRYVAYETLASDLLSGDGNGVSDVARADTAARPARQRMVSRSAFSGVGNGPSSHPVISGAGEFVLFDSEATNLRPSESVRPDPNGVRDVFLWNEASGNVSLESRDSLNGYLGAASYNPATSSRGNYVPFESGNPLPLQPPVPPPPPVEPPAVPPIPCEVDTVCDELDEIASRASQAGTPTEPDTLVPSWMVPQVWVRYLGPK